MTSLIEMYRRQEDDFSKIFSREEGSPVQIPHGDKTEVWHKESEEVYTESSSVRYVTVRVRGCATHNRTNPTHITTLRYYVILLVVWISIFFLLSFFPYQTIQIPMFILPIK